MDEKVSHGLTQYGDMVLHFKGQGFSFEEAVRLTSEVQELFLKREKFLTEALKELKESAKPKAKNPPSTPEEPASSG